MVFDYTDVNVWAKVLQLQRKTLIYHLNDPSKYFSLSGRGPSGNIQGIHI